MDVTAVSLFVGRIPSIHLPCRNARNMLCRISCLTLCCCYLTLARLEMHAIRLTASGPIPPSAVRGASQASNHRLELMNHRIPVPGI
jgi:hypothetical protein